MNKLLLVLLIILTNCFGCMSRDQSNSRSDTKQEKDGDAIPSKTDTFISKKKIYFSVTELIKERENVK